jgi:amino acid adenylation domain-containing protein
MKKLDKKSIEDIIALTPMQEGILAHYLKEPGSDRFFEQLCLNLSGTLHIPHFETAWDVVIESNEMLRAIFRWETLEKPVQVILKEHRLRVRYFDLSARDAAEKEKHLEAITVNDRQEGFDLGEIPFRVTLCKTGEGLYELIISNHHILYDGWSSGIILKEFFDAFNALCKGPPLPAPPVKAPFKAFVRRLLQQDEAAAEQKKFWERYLAGFGEKGEPAVKKRKRTERSGTGTYRTQLPEEIKEKLEGFIKGHNITTASLFYSAWGVLLQRYNAVDDVLFDTTVSGRTVKIEGIENSVGLFINTLPLRVRTRPGETTAAFLTRTHDMLQQWKKFENSSLLNINEQLEEYRNKTLFDSVVVIENYPIDSVLKQENSPLSVHSFSITERTHYDLTVIITAFEDIKISITYNKECFDETSMEELDRYFKTILDNFLSVPHQKVDQIKGVPEAERNRLLNVLNDMAVHRDSAAYQAPQNETEKKLAGIWAKVLRVDEAEIGINSDFFDFGGHSLKAALLATAIHEGLNVKVPLAEVFKRPTIKELADFIKEAGQDKYTAFEATEKKEYYPLSSAQRRFYMLQQADLQSKAYNAPYVMLLEGEPDMERLEASFKMVIQRHESLRTAFIYKDGEPVQKIQDNVAFEIEHISMEHGAWSMEKTQTIKSFVRPFDLSRAPLLRVGLIKNQKAKYLLLFDIHHIISDGSSINILIAEFMEAYAGKELPEQKYQYKDFCQWQYNGLKTGKFKQQEEFLLERFSGELPVLDLPMDFPRPPVQSFEGDRINFYFHKQLREGMDELTRKTGTTLYMLLTAALGILLSKYTGLEDIIIGSPTAGRRHKDLNNIFGLFVEMAAIRIFPSAAKTFDTYLKEVKDITLKSYENQDYPFGELKEKILAEDDLSRNPLFDVMLIVQNQGRLKLEIEDLKITPLEIENKTSKLDINLEVYEEEKGTRVELEYCTRLFRRSTMERFFHHLERVLGEVVENFSVLLSSIDMMSQEEKRQILEDFNDTDEDFPAAQGVHELFEDQVERTPYGTAVVLADKYLTYLELDRMSGHLANILRGKGVKPDDIVGIMPERSLEAAAGLLGILKAGGAYLPMDTDYPAERVTYLSQDSNISLLLTTRDISGKTTFDGEFIYLDELWKEFSLRKVTAETGREKTHHPANLAYVLYTSGSTGRPKGVGVEHGNVVNILHWFARSFDIQTGTPLLQLTDYTFDPSVEDIFGSLIHGGVLHIADRELVLSRERFRMYVDRNRIEIVNFVPTMLIKLLCPGEKLESLRVVISGGERLEETVKDAIVERGYHLYNNYGPTEITVDALSCLCAGKGSRVTIGRPVSNMKSYILDSRGRLVPVGIVGELCISGAGVARIGPIFPIKPATLPGGFLMEASISWAGLTGR